MRSQYEQGDCINAEGSAKGSILRIARTADVAMIDRCSRTDALRSQTTPKVQMTSSCRRPPILPSSSFSPAQRPLVYQVAWMRKLSLFFGSDVYFGSNHAQRFHGGGYASVVGSPDGLLAAWCGRCSRTACWK